MAFIAVNELRATGAELFQDSESFLNELNNLDDAVHGGDSSNSGFSSSRVGVENIVVKALEFGVIGLGIDAIGHLAKSFSHGDHGLY